MAPLSGSLKLTVLRARNLKNRDVVNQCNPFIRIKVDGEDAQRTAVINDNSSPVYNETYTFRSVNKDQTVAIEVLDKDVGKDVLVATARVLPAEWGTKGRPIETWVPVQTKDNKFGGDVLVSVEWDCILRFKMPFSLLAQAADTTCAITAPLQRYIEAALTLITSFTAVPVIFVQSLLSRLGRMQQLLLLAIVVGITLFFGTVTAICVGGPALFFFPITIFLGFCAAGIALVVVPILLVIGWVVLCSRPVQARLVKPTLVHVLSSYPVLQDYVLK